MNRIPVLRKAYSKSDTTKMQTVVGTLELKFSNGGVYEFFNVPTKMYDEFMHAPSRDDYSARTSGSVSLHARGIKAGPRHLKHRMPAGTVKLPCSVHV